MNDAIAPKQIEILSVEDNVADATMIRELLKSSSIPAKVNFVTDGSQAIDYVRKRGAYAGARRPALILLDLSLPKKGGKEVLKELKQDPDLRCIPILVLSTSNARRDIHECYEHHANAYLTKPNDLARFDQAVKAIENFWFLAAELPDSGGLIENHRTYAQ